jgi:guanine deaminase
MVYALRGKTLTFKADPFAVDPQDSVDFHEDGAVIVNDGQIVAVGPADQVLKQHPGLAVTHYSGDLIMAGFVDCHTHFPQMDVIASYGKQLIDWLSTYTFPAELKFANAEYAAQLAPLFLDECLRNGTTTISAYCTVHPQSVDALFTAAAARGMAIAAGKVMMDRHAPAGLLDTAQSAYDDSKALIERWHGNGRATYVVSPRFAPTSSPEQLHAARTLWREHPGTLMQTHVSENRDEIDWVRTLYPDCTDYVGVYEKFGLLGPGANLGHAIHLSAREIAAILDSGTGISHCPTSNLFIGSGLFDLAGLRATGRPIPVGLATDIGGGSSFSMFATMRAAYEIAQLRGFALHPARAFWLATQGSAQVMHMADRIGNLAPGYAADMVVINLQSHRLMAHRVAQARDIGDVLFAHMILADDRAIRATYVAGQLVHSEHSSKNALRPA